MEKKNNRGGNGSINNVEGYCYVSASQAFLGHISADVPSSKSNTGDFLLDTGSTPHITSDRSLLENDVVKLDAPLRFSLPHTEAEVQSSEKGDLQVGLATGQSVLLRDVHYISAAQYNILSAGRLQRDGWTINLPERTMRKGKIKLDIVYQGVLPYVQIRTTSPSAYPSSSGLRTEENGS